MWHKQSTVDKQNIKRIIQVTTSALITDFVYNHNGNKIAIADSQGNVYILQRTNDIFQKVHQFKGDQAAIWKLSWCEPIFGQMIAIGSFKKKVAVFQFNNKNNKWMEIARHEQHQGSANHVEWAPAGYGVKVYSAGSDGVVCVMQVRKNNWQVMRFKAHEGSINCLAIKGIALNSQNRGLQQIYPTIATVGKDLQLKVWRHTSQARLLNIINNTSQQQQHEYYQQNRYYEVSNSRPHKQFTRALLFQPFFTQDSSQFPEYNIISGSQDGIVKINRYKKDKLQSQKIVHKAETPVVRVAQSLTGKYLTVGGASHSQQGVVVYCEKNSGEWEMTDLL